VEMSTEALDVLTKIAKETSLRYAMHMIMTSSLVMKQRRGAEVEPSDIRKVRDRERQRALSPGLLMLSNRTSLTQADVDSVPPTTARVVSVATARSRRPFFTACCSRASFTFPRRCFRCSLTCAAPPSTCWSSTASSCSTRSRAPRTTWRATQQTQRRARALGWTPGHTGMVLRGRGRGPAWRLIADRSVAWPGKFSPECMPTAVRCSQLPASVSATKWPAAATPVEPHRFKFNKLHHDGVA